MYIYVCMYIYLFILYHQNGLVVKVSAFHAVGRRLHPGRIIPKTIIEIVQTASLHGMCAL